MGKKMFLYNETKVWFHERIYNPKYDKSICPLCFKKLQNKDKVFLIINNYILFPNVFVHRSCVGSKSGCIKSLTTSYRKAKRIIKKYNFWFENGNEFQICSSNT